jgi:anhydro-N-acetylmuramic acid kinase
MSGTSLDGIDAVLLRLRGRGTSTRFQQLAYQETPFPPGLKNLLLQNSVPTTSRVDDITRLNVLLAELYAGAVVRLARRARVRLRDINLIGSHGQTLQHLPAPHRMFGGTIRATLQIGDPSVLATLTGIPTVGNFRAADMAVGGQGAPLVPYFDWVVFRSPSRNRLLLNIGGIANLTVLPRGGTADDVIAFDTGPGNMLVDGFMQEWYGKPFDRGGTIAASGTVSEDLIQWMSLHPYLKRRPPKSTGREEFGAEYRREILRHARKCRHQDVIATVSQFTAYAVFDSSRRFLRTSPHPDELIVSGGGARNRFITSALQHYFRSVPVRRIEEFGMSSDAKEAICFAVLAHETIVGNAANLPRVTGARKPVILGTVCRP